LRGKWCQGNGVIRNHFIFNRCPYRDRFGKRSRGENGVRGANGAGTIFTYNQPPNSPLSNQIASIGTSAYSYDAAGDVTGDGTNTYSWDAEGHMTKVVNGGGTAISTNTYNALGQRVRDVTTSVTTDEAYGAGGSLLWRYTGSSTNSNQRAYVPFNGRILAEYYGGSPGGTLFDHPDELGSNTVSASYNGSGCQEQLFYPFGQLWTGAGGCGMQQVFAQLPDYDPETNQYNTPNRHYIPMGRWMSPDPANAGAGRGNPQTWNAYAYTLNNPVTKVDPLGLAVGEMCYANGNCNFFDSNYLRHAGFSTDGKGGCVLDNVATPCESAFSEASAGATEAPHTEQVRQRTSAPKPHISKRDKSYLDKYYKPVSVKAKEYGVDPALPLGLGIESAFATKGTYLRTGDACGMTGGSTKHMTHANSPEQNVDELFSAYGDRMRGTGSNITLFLNHLEMEDANGNQISMQGMYNSVEIPPTAWKAFITGGINEMQRDIPIYNSQ
jgi:RHS repeat-associated protein